MIASGFCLTRNVYRIHAKKNPSYTRKNSNQFNREKNTIATGQFTYSDYAFN